MFKKKYKITSKIQRVFQRRNAMENLRDQYVKENNHSRAVQCAEQEVALNQKAWKMVCDLYPSLKSEELTYLWIEKAVIKGRR